MAVMIHTYDGESLAALKFVASIDFEKVGAERGSTADQQCTRSEPALLFYVAFARSDVRAIHPTPQHGSPAVTRTSAPQNPLRSHPLP